MESKNNKLINISKKTFIGVAILLFLLMAVAIVLTYVLPKAEFAVLENGETDYHTLINLGKEGGINIFKGIFFIDNYLRINWFFSFRLKSI